MVRSTTILLLVAALTTCDVLLAEEVDNKKSRVTVLGLGAMGCAAAEHLAGQSEAFELTVWNRSPGKCPALPDTVTRASSAAAAVDSADVAIVMLTATKDVLDVVSEPAVAKALEAAGTTVVSLVSASIKEAEEQQRDLAAVLGGDKDRVLSGPMLCPPPGLRAGQCLTYRYIGSTENAFDGVGGDVLRALGPAQRLGESACGPGRSHRHTW